MESVKAILKWASPWWWHYLLKDCKGFKNFWCRIKGHPNGVVFYDTSALEPDMHCCDCGEYLG